MKVKHKHYKPAFMHSAKNKGDNLGKARHRSQSFLFPSAEHTEKSSVAVR